MPPQTLAPTASPTDYDALAKQFGGTSAGRAPSPSSASPAAPAVDYDALAKQFGGTTAPAPPTGLTKAKGIRAQPSTWHGKLLSTLIDELPMLGGAVGGATGFVVGAPTAAVSGPAGPAASAVVGAGTGGAFGTLAKRYLRSVIPIDDMPLEPMRPEVGAEMGREASSQMLQETLGQGQAQIAGRVLRGGPVRRQVTSEVAETMQANRQFGTRLSGPEVMSGTTAGDLGKQIQSYASGVGTGSQIQRHARLAGTRNAVRQLTQDVQALATPLTRPQAGAAAGQGLSAAQATRGQTGQLVRTLAESGPPVSTQPLKDEALRIFESEIVPYLSDFPERAGSDAARKAIQRLRADPTLLRRDPRPIVSAVADAMLEKGHSPALKMIKTIFDAEDQVAFKSLWEERQALRMAAGDKPYLLSRDKEDALAKHFENLASDVLYTASPQFKRASQLYAGESRLLETEPLQRIAKLAEESPEAVVDYLKADAPTKVKTLRRALLGQAQRGPDAPAAKRAWNQIGATWWQEEIVHGGKPAPASPEQWDDALAGMAQRIRLAQKDGTLTLLLDATPEGRTLIKNGTTIAGLMEKRTPEMQSMLRVMFQAGRVLSGAASLVTRGNPSVLAGAATLEAAPAFMTWLMHNDRATQWFVNGVTARDPVASSSAMIRVLELYRRSIMGESEEDRGPVRVQTTLPPARPRQVNPPQQITGPRG